MPDILKAFAMRMAREDFLGPANSVPRHGDCDEAVRTVDAAPLGLAAALFSNPNDMRSGMIHVAGSGLGADPLAASAAAFRTTEHAVCDQSH